MIALGVSVAYVLGVLGCARWLYRNALAGGYEATETGQVALAAGWALAISLFWPIVLVCVATVRFITGPPVGGEQ